MDGSGRLRDTWPLHAKQLVQLAVGVAALTGVFVLVGWWLTNPMRDSALVRTDVELAEELAARRTPTWNSLTWWGSMLAETGVKIVVTAVLCLVLLKVFERWFESAFVAVTLIVEATVFLAVTLIVGRNRPNVVRLDGSPIGSSFPSGHTAAAVAYAAIAMVVFWHTRKRLPRVVIVLMCVAVPLIVGFSRMYRGMHHLTDTVAGILLGLASLAVTWAVFTGAVPARREVARPLWGGRRTAVATVLGDERVSGDDRGGARR
jgi:membrane-associated phospholipid phosphatase